jgi:hypothetical protein
VLDRGCEEGVDERAGVADTQQPRFTPRNLCAVLNCAVCCGQEILNIGKEGSAGGCEVGAVLAVAEQSKADFALELFDLKIERLWLHVQPCRGATEVEFLGNDAEVTQVP